MKNNILVIGTGSISNRHVENILKIDKNNKIVKIKNNTQDHKQKYTNSTKYTKSKTNTQNPTKNAGPIYGPIYGPL